MSADAPIMRDEIFGPILPVLTVDDLDAGHRLHQRAAQAAGAVPLLSSDAAYEQVVSRTSSGGMVMNHAMVCTSAVHGLPFGGVGESGMGAYHGKHSFDTFSHKKAVLKKADVARPDPRLPALHGVQGRLAAAPDVGRARVLDLGAWTRWTSHDARSEDLLTEQPTLGIQALVPQRSGRSTS